MSALSRQHSAFSPHASRLNAPIGVLLLSLFFCLAVSAAAAAQVKLEAVGPLTDAGSSPELRKMLAQRGYRVVLGNGEPLCDVWLAASLPPSPAPDTERTNYSGALAAGELAGVISFPRGAKDFRGQAIKPGAYTLRYMIMPNDGAHMGAAPQRDFLLLIPLAQDVRTATMPAAELLKASSAASQSNHPAVFLLLPPRENPAPAVYESPEGFVVFAGKAGTVAVALVVKGQAEQ